MATTQDLKVQQVGSKMFDQSWEKSLDFLWLEITPKCNLNCVHCYADSSPHSPLENKMTFNDWVNIMKESYDLGCTRIQFIGGEPTLHPDFISLIKMAKGIGYDFIEVYTNGTILPDDMISVLKENDVNLAFSFYSSNHDVHDEITMRKGSQKKTLINLKKALDHKIPLRVGIIEMDENKNETSATKTMLQEMGIENINIDKKRGVGRGMDSLENLNPMDQLCGACWKGQLVVDSNGDVFPCIFSRFNIVGSVEKGIEPILKKK